jgi:CheY-like chemotaxis protein
MPLKIVIADDFPDALEPLAWYLRLDGHAVYQAADGEAALALVEEQQPDLCFLDIGMPKLDGRSLAKRIREHAWGRGMWLVAMSGYIQGSDVALALGAGFDGFVPKPVDPERFRVLCKSVQDKKDQRLG